MNLRGLTVSIRGPTRDECTRVMRQYARDAGRFRGYELGSRGYL